MAKIFCGLDLGTNDFGYAVTDENYSVIKKGNKSLWGVRLFEEAETQANRRLMRGARRRSDKKKERIILLQKLFFPEISKVDENFFVKLEEGFCKISDKTSKVKYNLFCDKDFTDKNYYRKYPTIYHLRRDLIDNDEKKDIRLVYLALHHMIKYRGNFTYEKSNFNIDKIDMLEIVEEVNALIEEREASFCVTNKSNEELFKVLLENKGISKRKEALWNYFEAGNNKLIKNLIALISGAVIKLKDIFDNEENEDVEGISKISFSNDKFDEEVMPILVSYLGDDSELISKCKELYDCFLLKSLVGNEKHISKVMVSRYEKHQNDLLELKKYVNTHCKEKYSKIFRLSKEKNNYSNYVGSTIVGSEKETLCHASVTDFYNFLKKELGIVKEKNDYFDSILLDMEANQYLPRLNSTSNGIFPYQMNEMEMIIILKNQAKHYDFLNVTDKYGSVSDKILSLLSFRIPYYVGPLNTNSPFSWVERTKEKIYPWNFNEVVDVQKSAEKFITRMTNRCTYLKDEFTLPKHSLIYSLYEVYSELNKININGNPIEYDLKMEIIDNLFKNEKKVTIKKISNYIEKKTLEKVEITTSNGKKYEEIKSSLSAYVSFKGVFSDIDEKVDIIDDIIKEITIFEDKRILINRLKYVYKLSEEQIKKIKSFNFSGWGNLSKKLLTELKSQYVDELGEIKEESILDVLKKTNLSFMEIIYSSSYNFRKMIDDANCEEDEKLNEEYIENLNTSPANKRMIWQAMKAIIELEGILGKPIDKFFIETTRSDEANKETKSSRKKEFEKTLKEEVKKILDQYSVIDSEDYNTISKSLEFYSEKDFRSKKLFLYFKQMGKCMYSGEPINLDLLLKSDMYDIDHIIPQSLIKDDSFNNTVLVLSSLNRAKKADYPIKKENVTQKARDLWKFLHTCNLLPADKYDKLTRRSELTDEEISRFVNRQLVFTGQATKIVAETLKRFRPEAEVIYSKASNVSAYRQQFNFLKCRDTNDFHHAHDAYLNIVVGSVFNAKYGYEVNAGIIEAMKKKGFSFSVKKIYDKDVFDKQGKPIWLVGKTEEVVRKQLLHHDINVTIRPFTKKGMFYKQTIFSPNDGKTLIPLKGKGKLSDTKYGGYSNVEYAYFVLVKGTKKGKETFFIDAIPTLLSNSSVEEKEKYIFENNKFEKCEIVLDRLLHNTMFEENGFEFVIRGKSDRMSMTEMHWRKEIEDYLKSVLKYLENGKECDSEMIVVHESKDEKKKSIILSKEKNILCFDEFINNLGRKPFLACDQFKNVRDCLIEKRDNFLLLSITNQMKILKNLLTITKCNSARAGLELIGGPKEIRLTYTFTMHKGIKIITKSITGYYKKVLWEFK